MRFKPFKDLRRAMRAPARLAAAYRQLFRHYAPPMWLFDPATLRVLEVNEAALAEYGLSREGFLALPVTTLLGGAAFDAAAERPTQVAYQRPNGTRVQFELTPRLMPDTAPPVWSCTVANIAHRSDAEKKLQAVNEQMVLSGVREQSAREELERASRAKDTFLAVVSHELRTPLQSMMGWVQLLRQGKLNAADSAHALEVIERNTRIQAQLVADMLDVSRAESGKLSLERKALDLRTVVTAVVDALSAESMRANVCIDVLLPPAPVPVWGDAIRLNQVMMNLLSNAMKFTLGGGTVHVALETDKEWAHLRIADSGQGFGRAFLEAMFQPFSQEEEATTRSHGGLGLGLMIVKRLVEAHGGRVSAESAGKGMGATFFVDLPRGDSEIQADAETKPQARAAAEGRAILQGLRTLIVEDHADSRQLLHTILQHYGAHVFDAASAGEGLALLKSENVDVIVSDVGMPEVDGYEFLRFLRRGEMAARNVPVIALSAYAGLEDRQRALAAGFQAYATKPINPRELVDIIAGAAGRTDG